MINQTGVLFVDDEEKALKVFRRAFSDSFEVFTASSAADALEILSRESERIGVVVTDQRMPERSGISMLSEVRRRCPGKIRLLTTAYTQVDTLVDAINEGAVYSFISKPWDLEKLRAEIFAAIKSFSTTVEQQALLDSRIEELRLAVLDEKVMEIGNVAVNLSHYVDNALCPVELLISKIEADLADRTGPLSEVEDRDAYLELLKRIRIHIGSTSRQISSLHEANTTLNQATLESVDLVALCREAIKTNAALIQAKDIRLHLQASPEVCSVYGDKSRLLDFFSFLLAEEVVSLPKGSAVDLRIAASADSDGIEICLEDNEPLPEGVSSSHLFYPFNVRSGDPRQLGVFLICAYFILRSHDGTMRTKLREGGSSVCFTFTFPTRGPHFPLPEKSE